MTLGGEKMEENLTEKEWIHNGLKCKVVFVRQSHRCGYVAVPKKNPAYGKNYDVVSVDVHGGLTYGSLEENEFWLGFDCAHAGDRIGGRILSVLHLGGNEHFWTLDEVVEETNKLAEQLAIIEEQDCLGYEISEFLRETPEEKLLEWSRKLKLSR